MPRILIIAVIVFIIAVSAGSGSSKKAKRSASQRPAPAQRAQKPSPAAQHLCDDPGSHKMTYGAAGDDLTAEVEAMNRRNRRSKEAGPLRLHTITAEDLADKRRELKILLDGGIIDRDEYHSILRDWENSRIF